MRLRDDNDVVWGTRVPLRDDCHVVSGVHARIAGRQPVPFVKLDAFAVHADVIAVNEADDGR